MPSYSQGTSTSGPQMIGGMVNIYNELLRINQGRYANVLQAYTGGLQRMQTQLAGIYGGFQNLQNRELRLLGLGGGGWGIATPAYQAIRRQAAQTGGQQQQDMINRGLGNTTVGANLAQQNAMFTNMAYGSLGAQLAQLGAGVVERTGLAGLAARMQGAGMEGNYTLGGLSAIGQPARNEAGQLFGMYGTSQQFSSSTPDLYGGGGGGGGSSGSGLGGGGLGGTGYYSNPARFNLDQPQQAPYGIYGSGGPGWGSGDQGWTYGGGGGGGGGGEAYGGEFQGYGEPDPTGGGGW